MSKPFATHWVFAALPLAACASTSDSLGTSSQALEVVCVDETGDVPEDAWACGESLTVECDPDGTDVDTLYVVPVEDPDFNACGAELSVSDEGPFAVGSYTIDVTVDADGGPEVVCSADLEVVDTEPPELVEVAPIELWPPNHKMHRVEAGDCFEVRDCDPDVSFRILSATSDEPFNDIGDGNHEPDIVFDGCDAVELRAERQGPKDGRVYTLEVEATDADGNVSEGTCTVVVPHDQSGRAVIDSGVAETVEPEGCEDDDDDADDDDDDDANDDDADDDDADDDDMSDAGPGSQRRASGRK